MSERIQQRRNSALMYEIKPEMWKGINEIRTYYPFYETGPHLPFEVCIIKLPPNHTQSWYSHKTVEETIIPICGQVNIFIKGQDDKVEKTQLPKSTMFDLESESIVAVSVIDDGTVSFIVEDKKSGKMRSFDIQYDEGTHSERTIHTLQNHSEQSAVVVVVKTTTEEDLARNPRIFREDRESH